MRNGGVLLASLMIGFRAHTRVLATLSVAMLIAFLAVTGPALQPVTATRVIAEKATTQTALPLDRSRAELPRTVIRFFFLLPHLIPHDR